MVNIRYKHIWEGLPEPKAAYQNFYNRIATWRFTIEEAAKPWLLDRDRRSPVRIRWDEYPWEKVRFPTFRMRVLEWIAYENAISPQRLNRRKEKKEYRPVVIAKTHAQANAERDNKENHFIRVTMSKEEAKEYHRVYRSMINEIEEEIDQMEDTKGLSEKQQKLEFIKQQYQVFLSFNPI